VVAGWALTPLIVMASLRLGGLSAWSDARGRGARENTGPEGNSRPHGAVPRVAETETEPAQAERPR
jgi:hypothetical protein